MKHAVALLQRYPAKVAQLELPALFAAMLDASLTKAGTELCRQLSQEAQVCALPLLCTKRSAARAAALQCLARLCVGRRHTAVTAGCWCLYYELQTSRVRCAYTSIQLYLRLTAGLHWQVLWIEHLVAAKQKSAATRAAIKFDLMADYPQLEQAPPDQRLVERMIARRKFRIAYLAAEDKPQLQVMHTSKLCIRRPHLCALCIVRTCVRSAAGTGTVKTQPDKGG